MKQEKCVNIKSKEKGEKVLTEELKQRLQAKASKKI